LKQNFSWFHKAIIWTTGGTKWDFYLKNMEFFRRIISKICITKLMFESSWLGIWYFKFCWLKFDVRNLRNRFLLVRNLMSEI
jgi:hypothetical protein